MRQPVAAVLATLAATAAAAAPPSIEQLLTHVPANSTAVVAVDVAALRTVPIVQQWLQDGCSSWTGVDSDATAFLRDAGLDPTRDVDLLVVAVTPGHAADGEALVLAAGRYDPASLGAALVKEGATTVTVAGGPAYRINRHGGPDHAVFVMRPAADLIVAGTAAAVAAAFSSESAPNALVADAVRAGHVDVTAPFWAVMTMPREMHSSAHRGEAYDSADAGAEALADVVKATASVQRLAVSGWLGDALTLRSVAVASTEENAGLLRDAIKGALAAARLEFQQRDPRLVEPLRDTAVTVSGATVEVRASVPVALLKALAAGSEPARSAQP